MRAALTFLPMDRIDGVLAAALSMEVTRPEEETAVVEAAGSQTPVNVSWQQ